MHKKPDIPPDSVHHRQKLGLLQGHVEAFSLLCNCVELQWQQLPNADEIKIHTRLLFKAINK